MADKGTGMNLYQKLASLRKKVVVLQKNKQGYGYKYVTEDEILSKITGDMDKLGLSLIPNIQPGTTTVTPYSYTETKVSAKGVPISKTTNDVVVTADMSWTWVNNENPEERIVVPWTLVGQQAEASQAFGSGLTYSSRYFLLKYFNIATTDEDPDNFRAKQKEVEEAEDKEVAEAIVADLDKTVRAYIAAHSGKSADVKKFISGYVKGGNYFSITKPDVAARLLEDFRTNFDIKE